MLSRKRVVLVAVICVTLAWVPAPAGRGALLVLRASVESLDAEEAGGSLPRPLDELDRSGGAD